MNNETRDVSGAGSDSPMVPLIRVFSAVDESLILSMLDSAGIDAVPSASNFQRAQFGTLYAPETGVTVSVNPGDLAEARAIAGEFVESRKRGGGGGLPPEPIGSAE